jgi:hypothetical protein
MPVPYATVAQLVSTIDERLLAEIGIDAEADGVVDGSNAILVAALTRASHEVQSFALRGGVYTESDLDAMQAATNWALIGTVCDLAYGILIARRGGPFGDSVKDRVAKANSMLKDLRDGMRVFPISGAVEASKPSLSVITESQRGALRMVADSDFFPRRRTTAS